MNAEEYGVTSLLNLGVSKVMADLDKALQANFEKYLG
jgi:hypothetical protein